MYCARRTPNMSEAIQNTLEDKPVECFNVKPDMGQC